MEEKLTEECASLDTKITALGKVNEVIASEILSKKSFSVVKYSAIVVDWKIGLKEERIECDSTFISEVEFHDTRCANFDALLKLNKELQELANKNHKNPEIMSICKNNLELIQTALGDLDSKLKDIPSNAEIKQDVVELNYALRIFTEKVQQLNEMADRSLHFEQKSAKKRQGNVNYLPHKFQVRFLGFAFWTQNSKTQSLEEQDKLMDQAAHSKFPGSRAASASEFQEHWIENIPNSNTSGQMLSFRSPENIGIPFMASISGYALVGVDKGESLNGEFTHDGLLNGNRSILCVKELD